MQLPLKQQWKRLTLLGKGMVLLAILFLVGLITAGSVVTYYYQRASGYDLDKMDAVPQGVKVLDVHGRQVGTLFSHNRKLISLEETPDHLIAALLSTEDAKFFDHPGFDIEGILRAAVANVKSGHIEQGASTITQQLARHVFGLEGRTFDRKFTEILLATRMESAYEKEKILEVYLNWIYLGGHAWGFGAATDYYFDKNIEDLTPEESALLVGLVKSPNTYNPFRNPDSAKAMRNETIDNMVVTGALDPKEGEVLKQRPLGVVQSKEWSRSHPYVLDHVRRELLSLYDREELLSSSWTVETSYHPRLQQRIEVAIDEHLAEWDPKVSKSADPLQTAVVVLDNMTGEILASHGGRDFSKSQYNRVVQAQRRPGSAFLPFTYAAAFSEDAVHPWSTVWDAPMDNRRVMIGGTTGILGEWGTETETNRYFGKISAAGALMWGKNAATIRVGLETGREKLEELARRAGIKSELRPYSNAFLGSSEMTLLELTHAYTIFPNHGVPAPAPHFIRRIVNQEGQSVYKANLKGVKPAVDGDSADQVHLVLWNGMRKGISTSTLENHQLETDYAVGKSGTTNRMSDAWYIGYDGAVTCGVWIGKDRPVKIAEQAFGHTIAMPLWVDAMNLAGTHARPTKQVVIRSNHESAESLCLISGFPVTEKCHGNGPELVSHRFDVPMVLDQAIKETPCPVHTGNVRKGPATKPEVPSPKLRKVEAVEPQGPGVDGPNPYQIKKPEAEVVASK